MWTHFACIVTSAITREIKTSAASGVMLSRVRFSLRQPQNLSYVFRGLIDHFRGRFSAFNEHLPFTFSGFSDGAVDEDFHGQGDDVASNLVCDETLDRLMDVAGVAGGQISHDEDDLTGAVRWHVPRGRRHFVFRFHVGSI